ncbi:hypothetical protein pb186bvf_016445 [Paramecium bursaria]
MNKLTCVLIGELGVGKTSVFNKICGTQELADSNLKSNTLKIAQSRSIEGYGFNLIDSPGIGAYSSAFVHAIGILAALTDGPINQILLVVKYKKRIDILRQQIEESITIIKQYYQITTIIITHWDQCEQQQKIYKSKAKEMIGDKFKIYSVIFSFKEISSLKLCTSIDKAILSKQNQGQLLSISNSIFEKLLKNEEFEKRLETAKNTFIENYEEFSDTCKQFLTNNFKTKSEREDSVLHYLKAFIIDYSKKVQKKFEKDYGALMEEVYICKNDIEKAYIYYLCLKQKISEFNQGLIQIIYSKMKYQDNHPLRSLRKCPLCKMIWYKQSGCDVMICGRSIEQHQDNNQNYQNQEKQSTQTNSFKFRYIKEKQQIVCKEVNRQIDKQLKNENKTQFNNFSQLLQMNFSEDQQSNIHLLEINIREQIIKNGYVGCGQSFYWPVAPLVNFGDICLEEDEMFIMLTQNQYYNFQNHKDKIIQQAQQEKKIII